MTTRELLREGEWTTDGRMLTSGTVTWSEPIPLLTVPASEDNSSTVVGAVRNIRREGNRIFGDLSIEIDEDQIVTCDVDNIGEPIEHDEGLEFTGVRLRAANLNSPDAYPWRSGPNKEAEGGGANAR